MAILRWLHGFVGLSALATLSPAQSCWRDTVCSGPKNPAFSGAWEKNVYAPASRTVKPKSVLSLWNPSTPDKYSRSIPFTLCGNGSSVVFDFGIEVGGIITLNYSSSDEGILGLAFTEAKQWIGKWSDSSNGAFKGADGALFEAFSNPEDGSFVMSDKYLRGGFRYLTVYLIAEDDSTVHIEDVSLEIGFQPTWPNLQAYQGYFHSNDELLNRIWYSGAYTLQTNTVPVNTGRQVPIRNEGWVNNATMGPGNTIFVDGAKRDRAVWPGDMGISIPSLFVSTGDLESMKNALQVMYDTQDNSTGAFDESGPPLSQKNSDTYHMWSMIGTYYYFLYTNDTDFLLNNWKGYQRAMNYIYGKVDESSGLLNVTGTRDWARWQQGYNNSEAQMILYHTLKTGVSLASWAENSEVTSNKWNTQAEDLRRAINKHCWDNEYGAFKDNATDTSLHPQDANSMALLYGVTNKERAKKISKILTKNWTPIGAVAPELPENISPFISSFEIQGHFEAGHPARALELIRRSWGWYLTNPNGTESTVIEGYLKNGTFGYRYDRGYANDESYVSHAHGQSTGPTSALTNYVLGLSVTSPRGLTWRIAPQFGDLTTVQGGFTTSLGKFQAAWEKKSDQYTLLLSVPEGTRGDLALPFLKRLERPSITIDGIHISRGVNYTDDRAIIRVSGGGSHKVEVR
ncbi:hypothetical protein EYZ11_002193 [Aspergillus tanneri]|uniref:Alpha-L-rhamnosidase six-hairpin glycosidase domain-containing protein n=1 Tax=Aspergillus tanneri TaxID=1220188 RepID=A0A4S3JRH5_9EURO|nr:uncharacterized protein ATNIH1004_008945 [Aspergillus tanneri]KAA8644738.1 hypothetical protein ATNIH1004_008945 [Aspergillus tanneri]THC98332.1 hypothetical protein EYZ11_002193 [Aspergillus tanneri]